MAQITYAQAREGKAHEFTAEASTLGLRPGEWPHTIKTPDMGNRQPFLREQPRYRDGELESYRYRQMLGCITLTVFND